MEFLVVAYDGNDSEAQARRQAANADHRVLGQRMIRDGTIVFSTAILDEDEETTIGSARVMRFDSRAQLDAWLETEPYVVQNVWQSIDVRPCRMGPAFQWVTLEAGGGAEH